MFVIKTIPFRSNMLIMLQEIQSQGFEDSIYPCLGKFGENLILTHDIHIHIDIDDITM